MTLGNPVSRPGSASPTTPPASRPSLWRSSATVVLPPLTHHEIIGLIEPFSRRGFHADLAASNRLERVLVFKAVVHLAEPPDWAGASDVMRLENPRPEFFRLTRTLTLPDGAAATLVAEGPRPADLLARIDALPPRQPFERVAGFMIAHSYRLELSRGTEPPAMILTSAEARIDSLTLTLKAETGKGYPAEIELMPATGTMLELPDDLLATLGWDWRVLRRRGIGWTGSLKVPRSEPARSRRIERMLRQTVKHLAQTLAEPPRRFHERQVSARWRVVFRRSLPLLVCAALIAGTTALSFAKIPQDSMMLMMIFNFPPLMMLILFGMRELPRFEIPPLPRPSTAPSWLPAAAEVAASADNRPELKRKA